MAKRAGGRRPTGRDGSSPRGEAPRGRRGERRPGRRASEGEAPASAAARDGPRAAEAPVSDAPAARRELLAIQRRLWRRLQREIEASVEESPPSIAIYQEEYQRDLRRYEALATRAELVAAARAADVVYVGDYHTLPQAQKTLVKLLLALARRREVVLCVELVHAADQPALDAYMDGTFPEETFLAAIDYERTWGFPWPPYREIFDVARQRRVRVLGLNASPPDAKADHLLERDFQAARVIVEAMRAHPGALVLVFDGDLHVARDHLPLIVDGLLQRLGERPRRRLIVHQNAEEIHWALAREGREQAVRVVRLAADAYCVLNASPFEKLHSYLNWVAARDALEPPDGRSEWDLVEDEDDDEDGDDGDDRGAVYADQVRELVGAVARFLELEREDLDAFQLFTVNDLHFLDHLAQEGGFSEAELADVKRQILSNESYFIPKGDVIYLADFSVANAAEEATHFLHHRCAGYSTDRPRDLTTDFYFRAVTEALGFFGSKLVVPTRACWTELDCARFVERHARRERERRARKGGARAAGAFDASASGLDAAAASGGWSGHAAAGGPAKAEPSSSPPSGGEEGQRVAATSRRALLAASRLVLHHRGLERAWLETGTWPGAGRALTQPADLHLLITHMLGHMLGDKLYRALVRGLVDKARVRALFHADLEGRNVALGRYLELVRLTAPLDDDAEARAERL